MRKLQLLVAAAGLVCFTGVASAGQKARTLDTGGSGCVLVAGGEQVTVGEMMQTLRTRATAPGVYSGNPKQIVNAYSGAGWGNVGGLIDAKCGDPS